jgi:hypothetical protein
MHLKKKMPWLILLLALIPFVVVALMIDDWSRDLTTNTAATAEDAADPWLRPRQLSFPPADVEAGIVAWTRAQPRWSLADASGTADTRRLHLVRTTRLWRFRDDVHVTLEATAAGTRVTARSASRVGKGDLGQNPRNLRELMRAVAQWSEGDSVVSPPPSDD